MQRERSLSHPSEGVLFPAFPYSCRLRVRAMKLPDGYEEFKNQGDLEPQFLSPWRWWTPPIWVSGAWLQVGEPYTLFPRDQIANIHRIIEKARESQKNIYFCFTDYAKAFDCVDHNKLWKILKQVGIPDHLTYLLRNLYAGQEAIVRTGHGTTDWFQREKGVHQGCILSPCLFNLYAEHIMRNAGLEEAQAGIKIAGRNISNLRYADDTTFMAESKEELC